MTVKAGRSLTVESGPLEDNAAVNDTDDTAIGQLMDVFAQLDAIIR